MDQVTVNSGAVVLAIVKAKGESGAFAYEITQSLLKLKDKMPLEDIVTRPGPTGPDSDRIRNIVGAFVVRGFLEENSPARITPKGETWMNERLLSHFHDPQKVDEILSVIKQSV